MANAIKAKDTSKYLSPKQAERLQSRADAYFKINPGVKSVIATLDGNLFANDKPGLHAAEQHAKGLKSTVIIEIAKGDAIEGGNSAEVTASGKPNYEQAKRMNARAKAHFDSNPEHESILATVDGNLFINDKTGEHAAESHAKKLINTNVFEITKDEPVQADKDSKEGAKEAQKALPEEVMYILELIAEGDKESAKAEAEKLSDEHKKLFDESALAILNS